MNKSCENSPSTSAAPLEMRDSSTSESTDTIIQRLRSNDPKITFLVIGPPIQCRRHNYFSSVQKFGVSELIFLYVHRFISKTKLQSTLVLRGIFEPTFIKDWSVCEALAQNSVLSTLVIHGFDMLNQMKPLISNIATNSSLKHLIIMKCAIGEGFGELLTTSTTLVGLDISFNQLGTVGGIEIGKGLAANSTLTILKLVSNDLGDIGGSEIGKGLSVNSTLTELILYDNQLGDVAGTEIGKLLALNSTLTELNLGYNPLGEIGRTEIGKGLAANSTLRVLNLSSNQFGLPGRTEIGNLLAANSTLKVLNLSDNQLGEIGGSEIGIRLATNSTLTNLNVSFNKLGEVSAMDIRKWLTANSTLTKLNLSDNQLGEGGGMEIGRGLAVNSTLTKLNLSRNQLGESGMEIGKVLASNSTVKVLDLASNQLGDVGGMEIGRGLASNSSLTFLDISRNQLGEIGGSEIGKGLAANSTLTELDLSDNQLSEAAVAMIARELSSNSSLLKLYIARNRIGDFSFRMIANALCNSPLQTLDVSSSSITTIPSSLGFSPSLTSLDISGNPLIEPTSEFVESASLEQLKAYLRAPRTEVLRVRLSVVGYHGVGKTTLTTHLLHPEIKSQEELDGKMQELKLNASTHGIKTHLLQIPCAELGGKLIKFNTFDFAGQPIYYSNHRHFLGQHRVVYLIVFKATDSKMEAENQVNHWCNLIASQIDYKWREMFESNRLPKPSVIVVGTHLNLCSRKEPSIDHEIWFEEFIEDGQYASVFDIQPELHWIDHDAHETISELLDVIVTKGVAQLMNVDSTSPLSSYPNPSSPFSSHLDSNSSFSLSSHPEIISRVLAEIDRIRGSVSQWRLFYTLEQFQNTVLLADNSGKNDAVQLLIKGIGIVNLIIQMQAMGEVVYLRKAKKICIEPQRVFDLLADFVSRHREGSRDDVKQFVDHHMGIVSVDALRTVCTRYNLETRRKFKQQRQVVVLTLEVLIETLIDFDLCIKMASGEYLFPSLLPSDFTREQIILNGFSSHPGHRFDMQWQVASQNKSAHRVFIPSIMFGIQIDCYRKFPAPRFFLISWPTGILIKTDERYNLMIAMVPELPGGIRFSIQVDSAVSDRMTEFMKQIKKALKIVFSRIRSSMFQSTRVVGLCRYCSDLKLVPDERLQQHISIDSDSELETNSVELKHTIANHNHTQPNFVSSCLPLTPLWFLIDIYRAKKRKNLSLSATEFFFCSRQYSLSPDISDSPFHHPEFIRLASNSIPKHSKLSITPQNSDADTYVYIPSQPPTCSSSFSAFEV